MNAEDGRDTKLERQLAIVLRVGTWFASGVVAAGLVLPSSARLVTVGIALFIALPVVCVALLLLWFLRRGDYRIAVIAALVLAVIVLGFAIGMRTNARASAMVAAASARAGSDSGRSPRSCQCPVASVLATPSVRAPTRASSSTRFSASARTSGAHPRRRDVPAHLPHADDRA